MNVFYRNMFVEQVCRKKGILYLDYRMGNMDYSDKYFAIFQISLLKLEISQSACVT